jgi:hypothetical protein
MLLLHLKVTIFVTLSSVRIMCALSWFSPWLGDDVCVYVSVQLVYGKNN